ncbi:hypothetical protein MTO96_043512 [Rhipicephalus appendiculatus]
MGVWITWRRGLLGDCSKGKDLDNDQLGIPPPRNVPGASIRLPYVLVGDEAFPLEVDLMRPYPGSQLDDDRRVFNYNFGGARASGLVHHIRCLRPRQDFIAIYVGGNDLESSSSEEEIADKIKVFPLSALLKKGSFFILMDLKIQLQQLLKITGNIVGHNLQKLASSSSHQIKDITDGVLYKKMRHALKMRLKPDLVVESNDQVLVIDMAVVWDANEGVLKDKAKEKAAKYAVLRDLFDARTAFSTQGIMKYPFKSQNVPAPDTTHSGAPNVMAQAGRLKEPVHGIKAPSIHQVARP